MNNQSNIIMPLILATAIIVAAIGLRRVRRPEGPSLVALAGSIGLWSIAHLLVLFEAQPASEALVLALSLLGITAAASAQLGFALMYTKRLAWKPGRLTAVLSIVPVLTQILLWVGPARRIFFAGQGNLTGIWPSLIAIYVYSLVGASVVLLTEVLRRKLRPLTAEQWILPALAGLPVLAQLTAMLGKPGMFIDELRLAAFALAAIGAAYSTLTDTTAGSTNISRQEVVEAMHEGWMVLDPHQTVMDINPTAERMVGIPREKIYGQPISSILGDISKLGNTYDGVQEVEMKRSYKTQGGNWRYLNIRISSLADTEKKPLGHLVTWHDITDRKLSEDARQRARDEMFVLLNAISSEARESMSLEEFLTGSSYQIIYPFQSQMVAFFLSDDKKDREEDKRFILSSHFGFPQEAIENIPDLTLASPLFGPMLKEREPLLIDDPGTELELPTGLRNTATGCLLAVPLATRAGDETKTLGCMILGRKEKPGYSQDEVVRITTIADHVANLIDSDRRQKLAIALSERRRLMRDLHDSVTQKLYGLVQRTEAAQAAIEAGTKEDPATVYARLGDNARQALKEMRLFLYQMNPIDLESEGLVARLHHRLNAVEGRANTQARLLADDDICLSADKEIALYYIAQEALNNTLKHAEAQNVWVTLKQGRKNVILEIEDDGCGYDPKHADRAGLGLANINERVSNINGKLKITSRPGEGTKVVVTVPKDRPVTPTKHRQS
jgi:PAS domain S-box-containing protein